MELHVVGNEIRFCKYSINCVVPQLPDELTGDTLYEKFRRRFKRYRIEPYGVLVDNDEGLTDVKAGLEELDISYEVEDISPTSEQIAKAGKISGKVGSRTEAMDYITKDIVPERIAKGQELDDLKARLEKVEKK